MEEITRIEAWACRSPIETPVATSFGIMLDRPAVFVRLEQEDGCFGWGEAFANWPAAGAEHRANLIVQDIAPLVLGRRFDGPSELFQHLSSACHIRALQCGEPGPFRQAIAALDIAFWDLSARRAGLPVRTLINPAAAAQVPAYASGIHIADAEPGLEKAKKAGFAAFKVKVGFELSRDAKAVRALATTLRPGEQLLADANQAWTVDEAAAFLEQISDAPIGWLEEPIPADAPDVKWRNLAARSPTPLAGGENIAGEQEFAAAVTMGALSVLQPDIAKWGGFTGCLQVARRAISAGRRYCPHFLGGGIGLAASAHLLAAAGGDGMLEVDVNPNPLRDAFGAIRDRVYDGQWRIREGTGLGISELPHSVLETVTLHREARA